MKKLMVIVTALLFAGSIPAHGCGHGYYGGGHGGYGCGGGYYAPRAYYGAPVIVERPAPRFYEPYAYRGCHRGYEGYRGGYYR